MFQEVAPRVSQKDRKKSPSVYPLKGKVTATGGSLNTHGLYGVNSFLLWNKERATVTAVTPMEPVKKGAKQRKCVITRYSEDGQTVTGETHLTRSTLNKLYEEGDESVLDPFLSEQLPAWQASAVLELFSPGAIHSSFGTEESVEANKVTTTEREELLPVLSGMVGVLRKNAESPFGGINEATVSLLEFDKAATYLLTLNTGNGVVKAGIALDVSRGNIAVNINHQGEQIQIGYGSNHRLFKYDNGEPVPVDEDDVSLRALARDIFYYLTQAFPVAFPSAISERLPLEVKGTSLRRAISKLNINSSSLLYMGIPRMSMVGIGKKREERYAYPDREVTIERRGALTHIMLKKAYSIIGKSSRTGDIERRSGDIIEHYLIRGGELLYWTGERWEAVSSSLTCKRIDELLDRAEEAKEEQIRGINNLFESVSPESNDEWIRYEAYSQPMLGRDQLPVFEDMWMLQ